VLPALLRDPESETHDELHIVGKCAQILFRRADPNQLLIRIHTTVMVVSP
jgi:hypothetical protein